jgi:signal transduction histidine kinase
LSGAEAAHQLNPLAQTQLFRILAELLNNTIKHAGASRVEISLSSFKGVQFIYRDNGKGFDLKTLTDGRGLINISQRVDAIQGLLHRESDERGTLFKLQIPVDDE